MNDTTEENPFSKSTKRHTCVICKRKKYEKNMKPVLACSWACKDSKYTNIYKEYCYEHKDIVLGEKIINDFKKLSVLSITHLTIR